MNKVAGNLGKMHIDEYFCLKNSEYKSRENRVLYLCA